jgi:hypothetical protein
MSRIADVFPGVLRLIAAASLAIAAAGCAGAGPSGDEADEIEAAEQLDDTNPLVNAPTQSDGSPIIDRAAPPPHEQSAPSQNPADKNAIRQDPDPCPWTQKGKSSNDT